MNNINTINEYIISDEYNQFFTNILDINADYFNDFKSFITVIILENRDKYQNLLNNKVINFYVIRVILNQLKSNTSPFYKEYRSFTNINDNETVDFGDYNTEYDIVLDNLITLREEIIIEAIENALNPSEKLMIRKLFGLQGYTKTSYRKLGVESDINFNTLFSWTRNCKDKITAYINYNYPNIDLKLGKNK